MAPNPANPGGAGQAQDDCIEAALARALDAAVRAEHWAIVTRVVDELAERRVALERAAEAALGALEERVDG